MKSLLLLLAILFAVNFSYAQNTFPTPSGNVGIGTTSPGDLLHIDAGSNRKGITISSDGDINAYTDIAFLVKNAGATAIGSPIGWDMSHRKDGYFSDTPLGESSFEFYAILKGGGYYAPLSFKPDGNVVLVSNKNATDGNVGIGTTSPGAKLDIVNTLSGAHVTNSSILHINDAYNNGANGQFFQVIGAGDGTNYTNMNLISNYGYLSLGARNDANATPTNFVNILSSGNVGIGTISPDQKLTVNGTIHAKEVKVDLSVPAPDYVFEKSYKLKSLPEVAKYVALNKHLPEIPSAKVMKQNGVNVSELNMKLLKKVEELTLYLIQENKEKKVLEKRIEKLEAQTKSN